MKDFDEDVMGRIYGYIVILYEEGKDSWFNVGYMGSYWEGKGNIFV